MKFVDINYITYNYKAITNYLGIQTSGYLNPVYCSDGNAFLIAFTAQLGNTTLTDWPNQPQHH